MNVYEIDPIRDDRWGTFLEAEPRASIFHTRGWLEALHRTYGYTPIVFTTSPPKEPLTNGLAFCEISSWLSGSRLVSMPFSDHCASLVQSWEQLTYISSYLQTKLARKKWNYIEIRSPSPIAVQYFHNCGENMFFPIHKLTLTDTREQIWQRLHKDCIRRKIQRAAREQLFCEEEMSDSLLRQFYGLLLMTRRRHGVPPQPIAWFQNLVDCLGGKVKIRLAFKDGRAIAGILTLRYKQVMTYKYGCSDSKFSNLGGIQHLIWSAIQEGLEDRVWEFDMGRSDPEQVGLIAFKRRWGAVESQLAYLRSPVRPLHNTSRRRSGQISKYICSHVPSCVLAAAGRALYKHVG